MFFTSPLWLFGLLPWAAVALWLLWGRRQGTDVPFLELWRGPVHGPRARRSVQAPPLAVAMALLSLLLALLAAARPAARGGASGKTPITVILDRGITMSARGSRTYRFREAAAEVAQELSRFFGDRVGVDLVPVPGESDVHDDSSEWTGRVNSFPPTALDTRAMLAATLAERLASGGGPVVVITDQSLAIENDRVIQVAPEGTVRNAGIIAVAARELPRPQLMVRVRNDSSAGTAELNATSGGAAVNRSIDLPAAGAESDYFLDLERLGAEVRVELAPLDDLPADNQAWLVREGANAKLEPRDALPASLQRMMEVYRNARPASEASPPVAVLAGKSEWPRDTAAVVVATTGVEISDLGPARIAAHPITAHLGAGDLPRAVRVADQPPAGWLPLVSAGGKTLVAVSDGPPARVWVGFDADNWPTRPAFVIFWANVFDWLGHGGESFAAHPVSEWRPEWKPVEQAPGGPAQAWPGLYQRADGARRAFNAPAADVHPPVRSPWKERLASPLRVPMGTLDLAPTAALAAMACVVLAALTWRRRSPSRRQSDSTLSDEMAHTPAAGLTGPRSRWRSAVTVRRAREGK